VSQLTSPIVHGAETSVAKPNPNFAFYLFLIGGLVGLTKMALFPVPFGWGYEMVTLAQNLAKHGTFANPFPILATGPSAVSPPLYPFFLSLLIRLFGDTSAATLAATLANILAMAFGAALLPRVSWILFRDAWPGVIAGLFWLFAGQLLPDWDSNYTVAALLAYCALTPTAIDRDRFGVNEVLAPLVGAALILLNPYSVLVFVPYSAWLFVFYRPERRKRAAIVLCIVFVAIGLTGSLWASRNARMIGSFVLRTSFGITLYVSNNDCASPSLYESEQSNCYQRYAANTNLAEAEKLKQMGEAGYDKMRLEETKAWIHSHHEHFLQLTFARLVNFWFPPVVRSTSLAMRPFALGVTWLATLLSIPGLVIMGIRRESSLLFMVTVFLIYPLIYYVVISDIRFRYPILWLTFLCAGYLIVYFGRRVPLTRRPIP
jgi:hypothetical protein